MFFALLKNLFSTLFYSIYLALEIPKPRRLLYGKINHLFRIWVTSADNLLDNEDKCVLPLVIPGASRVMREVVAIMAADRVLWGVLKEAESSFRDVMKPQIAEIDALFGATLINADWEIRTVYFRRDFLAVGFSLKKVKELDEFRTLMTEKPAPQLSEPGHGGIQQPRLIALRYPVLKDSKMTSMVSLMTRTESFLKAVGLNKCKVFKIICQGKDTESEGKLSEKHKEITVSLPSTEWVIQYE